jgi:hypothetical protein
MEEKEANGYSIFKIDLTYAQQDDKPVRANEGYYFQSTSKSTRRDVVHSYHNF